MLAVLSTKISNVAVNVFKLGSLWNLYILYTTQVGNAMRIIFYYYCNVYTCTYGALALFLTLYLLFSSKYFRFLYCPSCHYHRIRTSLQKRDYPIAFFKSK